MTLSLRPPQSVAAIKGSALLVVMWCIAVMVTVLILATSTVEQEMNSVSGRIARDRARQLALAGLALADNPAVRPGDPILNQDLGKGERLQVHITSEEARLNLNFWLADERQASLVQLFRTWGMERRDAERLVYAMADWIDGDVLKRAQGAEVRDYHPIKNRPYNRPFTNLDEVRLVRDFVLLETVRPDWRSRISVRGQGTLDLMAAPADLIVGLTGCSPESVSLWLRDRWGRDGIRYSDDDVEPTLEQALGQLGLPPNNGVAQWLTVQGPTRRVQSIGIAGDYAHIVSVVTSRRGGGGGDGGGGGGIALPGGGRGSLIWKEERSGTVEGLLRSGANEVQF